MSSLVLLSFSSFIVSLILTPLCRDLFLGLGVVDHPDGQRKFHKKPVARMGGVAVATAYTLAFIILWYSPFGQDVLKRADLPAILKLLPAGIIIFVTGLLDDIYDLKPIQKLAGQIVAAIWAYFGGVQILAVDGHSTSEWWSLPLTVLWLVACTNAFNFIDGIDGLAAGLGFFATLTVLLAALLQNNVYLALACVPLAGALLGFLIFNFHPASIFLGDSGSLLIGFLLGCYGVIWTQKSATLLAMTAPVMTLAVPIVDMCVSIARRVLRSKPIFSADRGHIHHRLLDRGWGPRRVVLILYSVTALGATFSLLQSVLHGQHERLIIGVFLLLALLGVRSLDYSEFNLARRALMNGEFGKMLNSRIILTNLEKSLAAADTTSAWHRLVEKACGELGIARVEIKLGGEVTKAQTGPDGTSGQFQVLVPLGHGDYVKLNRDFFSPSHAAALTTFVDVLKAHAFRSTAEVEDLTVSALPDGREIRTNGNHTALHFVSEGATRDPH